MTHEEWLAMMKKRYDQFGNGFIDGHFDILRDKYKFESYVLDEDGNRWFIYELAVRDKKK
jgi:hypothetical protein